MNTDTQKEHLWLQKLVGEWTFEVAATMEPGTSPEHFPGVERVRSLGGFWIVAEGDGDMPDGGTAKTIMTLGFDPRRRRYVGTWIGSMMTHLWLYDGTLDAGETVLTLDTEGPDMSAACADTAVGGMMVRYQDVIELKNDDHRVLSSQLLGSDGTWHKFMTANYRRITKR